MLSRRDALSAEQRHAASQAIGDRLHPILRGLAPGQIVALYAAKGSEVETHAIDRDARAHGLIVAYPRIAESRALAFHRATREELVAARYGLREPHEGAPVVELAAIAMFVVPGVAFDRQGGRMGWGMGHYDATLAQAATATRVGLGYECQLVDHVPLEPHDQRLQMIITEVATYVA